MRKKPFKPYVYLLYTVCVKTEKESKVIILYFMLEICLCPVDDHSSLCLLEENLKNIYLNHFTFLTFFK